MRIQLIGLSLITMVVLHACGSAGNANEALKEEIIAIHDEVMPEMGKLQSLQKEFIEQAEQLKQDDSLAHKVQIDQLQNLIDELEGAYDGMFVWMRQFETDYGDMTDEEIAAYLDGQKEMVEKVNTDIKSTLKKAEEYQ